MSEPLALLPEYLRAHVRLTLAALLVGALLAVPAGIAARGRPRLEGLVLGFAGVIQTIPALALLAVMVPLLSGLGLPGIGPLPAFLALVLYSLLPILRNTVAGLHGVDPAVIEAARGVGMTRRQRLLAVELPLALPVILAGLRTATVWTVGMATLSTPVGAASLGNFIFAGLQTRDTASILTGCVAAAALALVLDGWVGVVGRARTARRRGVLAAALAALAALAGWAFAPAGRGAAPAARPVVVGAKTFTEQYVLAEILAQAVRRETGREAVVLASLGSTVAFDALRRDEIDLYVDYTGTLWATVMGRRSRGGSRREVRGEVGRWLAAEHGIVLAAALGFENAYCFAVRRETADRLRLRTLSDLARHARGLSLGSDYEFFARDEWSAVRSAYDLAFREQRTMDPSLLYVAIGSGEVDVITAYSSDGRIEALSLTVLEDEKGALPPYDAVVLASPRLAREAPGVLAAVRRLEGAIDAATMRGLNRMVDEEGRSPAEAAEAFAAAGRRPRRVTTGAANERAPSWSPDGRSLVFEADDGAGGGFRLHVLDLASGSARRVTGDGGSDRTPRFSRDGREVVFWSDRDGVRGVRVIDLGSGAVRLLAEAASEDAAPAWSPDGRWIVYAAGTPPETDLRLVDRSGRSRPLTAWPGRELWPRFSPDGGRVALFSRLHSGDDDDLYLVRTDGSERRRVTSRRGHDFCPAWSPDGRHLAAAIAGEGGPAIGIFALDGRLVATLGRGLDRATHPDWSPDGRRIAFAGRAPGGTFDIVVEDVPGLPP